MLKNAGSRTTFGAILLVLLAGCGGGDEPTAAADGEIGGACFASCGTGISACYSGPEMTASDCQSLTEGMCPDAARPTFVAGCECSDDPAQGPDDC